MEREGSGQGAFAVEWGGGGERTVAEEAIAIEEGTAHGPIVVTEGGNCQGRGRGMTGV